MGGTIAEFRGVKFDTDVLGRMCPAAGMFVATCKALADVAEEFDFASTDEFVMAQKDGADPIGNQR